MRIEKAFKTLLVIMVLSSAVYYGLTLNNVNIVSENEIIETSGNGLGQSLNIVLIIENERNGEIIYRMEKEDDLALKSLAGFFHFIIKGSDAEESNYYLASSGSEWVFTLYAPDYPIKKSLTEIRIGTGTTAPTYDDWGLEAEIYDDVIEAIMYSGSGLNMNASCVATFNIDNTYDITESGLVAYERYDFMIFRDVFSAISVISGDLLTVKYVIMFN